MIYFLKIPNRGNGMKILAIDSSSLVASAAVVDNGLLIGEFTINYKKTHSQTLLPMLDEMAKMIELDFTSLDAIAVAAGPGSFTGLRIGSATVKGLALALDKSVIAVPTLEALAYNLWGCSDLICPLMDARRNQVYAGIYRFQKGRLETIKKQSAEALLSVIGTINQIGDPVVFLGDGAAAYQQCIEEETKAEHSFAPAHLNRQRAGALAALAEVYYAKGQTVSPSLHKPEYLRLSQAERERMEKERHD